MKNTQKMMLKKKDINIKKKYYYIFFLLIVIIFIEKRQIIKINKNNNFRNKCYISLYNSDYKIIHIIITRFLSFSNNLRKEYILNGIRVMKKFLLPSLENQSCKEFIWILMLGNKANITSLKSLLNFNNSFQWYIIYKKDIKNILKNITRGFDILITTRIDYDDRIYYDAVNDVRKEININKPILLHGYKSGLYYFELDNKYYHFEEKSKNGAFSVFESLIIVLNKVNDIYNIYDFGHHFIVRLKLLKNYKLYGIKKLNYEPAIFDSGTPKFIWVRQKYSYFYNKTKTSQINKKLRIINHFNLNKFYGK